jgi:RNA polymerase sigma-70 factor (ECF subfamily)
LRSDIRRRDAASARIREDEQRLFERVRAGDRRSLERLLALASEPAYRYGRTFCGNPHDAEDVMQEVLMALARSIPRYRGEASIGTWAYTVARRACMKRRRRRRGEPARLETLEPRPGGGGGALAIADPSGEPEGMLARRELERALDRAIAVLPAGQRDVLWMRDVEGMPTERVARALKLHPTAVKSRLHRARLALRELLAPHVEAAAAPAHCPDTATVLSRYLEGELDAGACRRLGAHVAACPACARVCDSLRAALLACRRFGAARPPREVREGVRVAIRRAMADLRRPAG